MLVLVGLVSGEVAVVDPTRFSIKSLAAMAYLIVFASLITYSAHGWLLTVVSPTLVATYAFINPVIAVFLGVAFAGEVLSAGTLFAGGLVVSAVALMVLARPRATKAG